ncbi:hypothetical protein [Pseudarcicella hirudinis]|nr:hypothetical protein [Pseudarcicella hirudinis]
MSYSTKALALFGVLPLVLKQFAPGDVVLWYLFSTIISLQSIVDFGFRQTFLRVISYAFGGAKDIELFGSNQKEKTDEELEPNIALLTDIVSTMKYIYVRLTLVVFILMSIFGTWAFIKPVKDAANPTQAWICWIIVILVSCISFYGKLYMNFLEGLFKIALVRRVDTFTSLGGILTSIFVLLFAPTLINLIIVNQFWVLIVMLRDWHLCRTTENKLYQKVSVNVPFNKEMFNKIWSPAWRSGLSGFMSVGLTNLTGVVYAQFGNTSSIASYLLALRIINQIRDISMAPFYSKLPVLAMLRVKNDTETLIKVIKRGMFLSHMIFVTGFLAVGISSDYLLGLIHSDVQFVSKDLWLLIGIAFFIHRFGGMHIQVYLSTNHVISHIADGVSGGIYIITSLLLSSYVGVYAIPIGMIAGYLGFYAWYSALFSYKSLGGISFWQFEKKVSIPFIMILAIFSILTLALG